MIEINWNDGMKNRHRTPRLFIGVDNFWILFTGDSIIRAAAIKSSQHTKNGKWSNTNYVLEIRDDMAAVEVLEPWDGWGNSWEDLAKGVTFLAGEGNPENVIRQIAPIILTHGQSILSAAIERAMAAEQADKSLSEVPERVIVTRHAGLIAWLQQHGIKGQIVTGNATVEDVADKDVFGILPLWLAAEANSVTEVSMPDLPFEMRGKEYGCEQMDQWGAKMIRYQVRQV